MFNFNIRTPNHHRFMRAFVTASVLLLGATIVPLMGPYGVTTAALVASAFVLTAALPWLTAPLIHVKSVAPWMTVVTVMALQFLLVLLIPVAAVLMMQLVALFFAAGVTRWANQHPDPMFTPASTESSVE